MEPNDPLTPATIRQIQHHEQIAAMSKKVDGMRAKLDTAELIAKEAKEDVKAATSRVERGFVDLSDFIRQGPDYQFGLDEQDDDATPDWRSHPMKAIGFSLKSLKAITEVGITTAGEYADWMSSRNLCDLPGIGPAGAEEMQDVYATFWTNHPEYCQDDDAPDDNPTTDPWGWLDEPLTVLDVPEELISDIGIHYNADRLEDLVGLVRDGTLQQDTHLVPGDLLLIEGALDAHFVAHPEFTRDPAEDDTDADDPGPGPDEDEPLQADDE